jgi:hypothetical protein
MKMIGQCCSEHYEDMPFSRELEKTVTVKCFCKRINDSSRSTKTRIVSLKEKNMKQVQSTTVLLKM